MLTPRDMKALITVIVPIYNGELFLSACIQSVLEQSYPHWELLLIDDGSSDRTAKICMHYASLDPRIIFMRLPHGGVSMARNTGLTHGHGDYFFFLDSDDLIHPQTLETELRLMQWFGCVFAGLIFTNVDADFQLSKSPSPLAPECRYLSHTELHSLFGNNDSFSLGAIGGKLLSRSAIGDLLFPETITFGEDTLFLLDVIARGNMSAVILTGTCYFRRLHHNNTFYCQTYELKFHQLEAFRRLRARYFELHGIPGYWEQLCVYNVFNWYVEASENPSPNGHAAELRRTLLDLLCDDYARFLPIKRKCTARLYLCSPRLYRFLKRLYWKLCKLLTGKAEPLPKYSQREIPSTKI